MAKRKNGPNEAELDRDIATGMLRMALDSPKAVEALDKIQGSPEELQHMPIFLTQMITKARDKMLEAGMPFNEKIWAAEDGVLNSILDYLGYEGDERDVLHDNTLEVMDQFDKAGKMPPSGSAIGAARGPGPQGPMPMPPEGGIQ